MKFFRNFFEFKNKQPKHRILQTFIFFRCLFENTTLLIIQKNSISLADAKNNKQCSQHLKQNSNKSNPSRINDSAKTIA